MNMHEIASTQTGAAAAFLETLKLHGVEYLFGNAGTDFAAIIEAYATHPRPDALPEPVTVPHENLAVAMAHGAYLVSGKPQAVMVHVNVGTANAICGLINAARENVPLILCAGRTPITDTGSTAARNAFIHWGQEMFDQASILREMVKWDYELRSGDQAPMLVQRAVTIAMAHPRGPVYLTLPRETLSEQSVARVRGGDQSLISPASPDAHCLDVAAEWLAQSERAVVVAGSYGRNAKEHEALARLAGTSGIAVCSLRPRTMPMSIGEPGFIGFEPGPVLAEADLIIALECDAPWIPLHTRLRPDARVIHIAYEPHYPRYPVRDFQCDLAIAGSPLQAISALANRRAVNGPKRAARVAWTASKRQQLDLVRMREAPPGNLPTYETLARTLRDLAEPGDTVLVESIFPLECLVDEKLRYFGAPSAGGLGWGLGAALGVKLADRKSTVISVVGDGAYMFGNPTPAHFVSAANALPTLTIVVNNQMWAAVQRATLAVYPDSETRRKQAVFTSLRPSPDYHRVVEASGGHGEVVVTRDELRPAIERALAKVRDEGSQALVNVVLA